MGRHHRPTTRRQRLLGPHRASALLSAALLASVAGPGIAVAAQTGDDGGSGATSAGALDPAGSAVGTATGTDDEAGPDPVTRGVDGLRDTAGRSTGSGTAATRASGDADPDADPDADSDAGSSSDDAGTTVTLSPKNGSGVSGRARVTEDDVVATATGLDPGSRYVSFFYGATSSSSNANPCILDGTNPLPSEQTVGTWTVDDDGTGTLRADNPLGSRYRLQAGTMSIRKVGHGFSRSTALPVNPASYSLVACGTVQRLTALDPATDAVPALPKLPRVRPVS